MLKGHETIAGFVATMAEALEKREKVCDTTCGRMATISCKRCLELDQKPIEHSQRDNAIFRIHGTGLVMHTLSSKSPGVSSSIAFMAVRPSRSYLFDGKSLNRGERAVAFALHTWLRSPS